MEPGEDDPLTDEQPPIEERVELLEQQVAELKIRLSQQELITRRLVLALKENQPKPKRPSNKPARGYIPRGNRASSSDARAMAPPRTGR